MKYDINIDTVNLRNIWTFLRKNKLKDWVKVLSKPTKMLQDEFIVFKTATDKQLSYNSQKIMVERMLNDTYPDALGAIYIENQSLLNVRDFVFFLSENEPLLYDWNLSEQTSPDRIKYIRFLDEYELDYNFIVWVPVALTFDPDTMRAQVQRFTLPDKSFIIKTF